MKTIEQKEMKLKQLQEEAEALREEIKRNKKQAAIDHLVKHTFGREVFTSANGKRWYKFPKDMCPKDVGAYCTHWFLTDLRGNYISDKLTYEGHPCKPGWSVGSSYCDTEQSAINAIERDWKGDLIELK